MTQALMASREIIYPFSDGKRMAENTKQFRWILLIVAGLAQNGHRFNVDQASRPDDVSSGLEADAG